MSAGGCSEGAEISKSLSGIVPVLQTPFLGDHAEVLDVEALRSLVEWVSPYCPGVIYPAVASEGGYLSPEELDEGVRFVGKDCARLGLHFVICISHSDVKESVKRAKVGLEVGAVAGLVAIRQSLYAAKEEGVEELIRDLREIGEVGLPLIVQDLEFGGPGLSMEGLKRVERELGSGMEGGRIVVGWKVECVPAGPKYTLLRDIVGDDGFIAGGWAVQQMIEAMDRGVDAMIPEASMVDIYATVWKIYHSPDHPSPRSTATTLFRRLLPVLAFTNQTLPLSVAFFKRLLIHAKLFKPSPTLTRLDFHWDRYSQHIADELIALIIDIRRDLEKRK